jgi:hypothetical protein
MRRISLPQRTGGGVHHRLRAAGQGPHETCAHHHGVRRVASLHPRHPRGAQASVQLPRALSLEECHGQAAVRAGGLLQVGESSSRQHALLHRAWRGQALPARRLPQVGYCRRHASLHRAWRWQAMPTRELHQVGYCRRHAALHRARRGQAVPARRLPQVRPRRHGCLVIWNGMLMTMCSHH